MRRLCCGFGISVKKYWRSVAAITKRCGMRSENQKKERNAFARTGQRVIAMKKVYRMEDLDCANCAMKIERAISELPGVKSAKVSFMAQKLTIEAEDENFDELMAQVVALVRKLEPDCRVIVK